MKPYSTQLRNLLAGNTPLYKADLFMIGPCLNGQMIYATTGQSPITYGGQIYQPVQYGLWSRGTVTVKIGLESNSCKLTVFADNQVPVYFPGTSNAALLIDGIKYGLLGNAPVTIYTAYMPTYGQTTGILGTSLVETKFVGMVTSIDQIGLTKAVINVQDMLYLLNIKVPRRVIQASCSHTLYDPGCTLTNTSFARTGSIVAVGVANQLTCAHLTPITASGTFTLGYLKWTSGKNNGLISMVQQWTTGSPNDTIQLDVQPIFGLTVGDSFQIFQGCNKQFTTCLDFQGSTNAFINFGGQPFTPVPETAI